MDIMSFTWAANGTEFFSVSCSHPNWRKTRMLFARLLSKYARKAGAFRRKSRSKLASTKGSRLNAVQGRKFLFLNLL